MILRRSLFRAGVEIASIGVMLASGSCKAKSYYTKLAKLESLQLISRSDLLDQALQHSRN